MQIIVTLLSERNRIRFNNKRGSVIGQIEGPKDKVDQMAMWLKLQGKHRYESITNHNQNATLGRLKLSDRPDTKDKTLVPTRYDQGHPAPLSIIASSGAGRSSTHAALETLG